MTPTGHTGRVQPAGESRVARSAVVDTLPAVLALVVVAAMVYPLLAVGLAIGMTTTYATLTSAHD